jgi:GNAT superfamily N-acetyltransferase
MRPGEEALIVDITLSVWQDVSIAKNMCDTIGDINGHPWTDQKADHVLADINRSAVVLVGESSGMIAAFATLIYDAKYAIGTLGHLGVAAPFQNKGFGHRMIRASLDRMRADGMKIARIDTLAQNERCCRLYPSEGFREVARTVHFFQTL